MPGAIAMTLNTSRKQVPRCITMLPQLIPSWTDGFTVLNFGCGKWPELATEHLRWLGAAKVVNYDPNLEGHPLATNKFEDVIGQSYDLVIAANVLNVIRKEVLLRTLEQIKTINAGTYLFSIYEGDRSNHAIDTKYGYQRNAKTNVYIPEVYSVFMPHHLESKYQTMIVTM